MDPLTDAAEAATATGLNRTTIYKLARKYPEAPWVFKAGRTLRVDVVELRQWMRDQARQGKPLKVH